MVILLQYNTITLFFTQVITIHIRKYTKNMKGGIIWRSEKTPLPPESRVLLKCTLNNILKDFKNAPPA